MERKRCLICGEMLGDTSEEICKRYFVRELGPEEDSLGGEKEC